MVLSFYFPFLLAWYTYISTSSQRCISLQNHHTRYSGMLTLANIGSPGTICKYLTEPTCLHSYCSVSGGADTSRMTFVCGQLLKTIHSKAGWYTFTPVSSSSLPLPLDAGVGSAFTSDASVDVNKHLQSRRIKRRRQTEAEEVRGRDDRQTKTRGLARHNSALGSREDRGLFGSQIYFQNMHTIQVPFHSPS